MSDLTPHQQANLLATYAACLENATDLLIEAEFLIESGRYARAYMLAFTAIEEVSKSQLVADYFTSYISKAEFTKSFRSHHLKAKRVTWAVLDTYNVDAIDETEDIVTPKPADRMSALYVDIDHDLRPITPEDSIDEHQVSQLIEVVHHALDEIATKEFMGEQIGTKGFMK